MIKQIFIESGLVLTETEIIIITKKVKQNDKKKILANNFKNVRI